MTKEPKNLTTKKSNDNFNVSLSEQIKIEQLGANFLRQVFLFFPSCF
jgi:hypothetical protein